MNSLLTTMAWQTILEKNGILNQFLRLLSLPDVSLINTPAAIVIGMIYNFLPYMILPLYVALSKINGNVIAAARDLGPIPGRPSPRSSCPCPCPAPSAASPWSSFRR